MQSAYDIVIVGAGASGLAAAHRLARIGASVVVLEARDRLGGRAHTVTPQTGLDLDLGCGWLHSGDRNPWTAIAQRQGLTIDRTPAAWGQEAPGFGMSQAERRAFGEAFDALEERLEAAASEPRDQAGSAVLDPNGLWTPLLNAFSAFYNGAEFDQVSVRDYAAYEDDGVNWRVTEGYGRTVANLGANAPVVLEAPVSLIDHGGARIRLVTAKGVVEARAAIVTVSTDLIAGERLRFDPPLPDKIAVAQGLPLGLADKLFLALDEPDALPKDAHLFGRIDRTETGSYYLRPFGWPLIEVFFGGRHARALEAEGPGAQAAFALEELGGVLGSAFRARLRPIVSSRWAADPYALGSYSHALPGRAGERAVLAAPADGRLFFAGEATSKAAFSTAHGAYLEGVRAADEALAALGLVVQSS
jgi:monoamine oxidase